MKRTGIPVSPAAIPTSNGSASIKASPVERPLAATSPRVMTSFQPREPSAEFMAPPRGGTMHEPLVLDSDPEEPSPARRESAGRELPTDRKQPAHREQPAHIQRSPHGEQPGREEQLPNGVTGEVPDLDNEPSDYDLKHPYYADDNYIDPLSDFDTSLESENESNGDGLDDVDPAPSTDGVSTRHKSQDGDQPIDGDSDDEVDPRPGKPAMIARPDRPVFHKKGVKDAPKISLVPEHLRQTATGRAYGVCRCTSRQRILCRVSANTAYLLDPGGRYQKSDNALFPEKYEKGSFSTSLPFICAIRSCRRLFKIESALSKHWQVWCYPPTPSAF